MALGYIVASKDDSGTTLGYWTGNVFTATATSDDLLEADFIPTLTDARFIQGSIQASNTAVEVVKLEAESVITLV
nr:hypothetical protein [Nostoc sp. EkiNYC01]